MAITWNWDAISAGASALGLLFVAYSVWQVKRSLDMGTISNLYGSLHHVHSTFIEYPSLRPYFYHGAPLVREEVGEEAYMRARSIAEMYLDTFENVYALQPWAPRELRLLLVQYIRHMCEGSPFLRSYLLENADLLHPSDLVKLVQRAEARAVAEVS